MSTIRTILIVEHDFVQRDTLASYLSSDNEFIVDAAGTLSEAAAALSDSGTRYDTVLLDIAMPDGDGRDFCTQLRRHGLNVPVIMLTGATGEMNVVRGLESGANDYIIKPFRPDELVARLRVQFRTFDDSQDASFTIGHYTFHPSAKLLRDVGTNRRIRLTHKEVEILKFLYRSDAYPVDRQTLLHEVWGHDTAVLTHTLETHIHRLRQKMESDPADPVLLVTETGGYRLNSSAGALARSEVTMAMNWQSARTRWW